jgi:hypothetical protein
MEIQEIVRRLRAGDSDRAIHQALGMHRETVKKYPGWAGEQGLLTGELPLSGAYSPTQRQSRTGRRALRQAQLPGRA